MFIQSFIILHLVRLLLRNYTDSALNFSATSPASEEKDKMDTRWTGQNQRTGSSYLCSGRPRLRRCSHWRAGSGVWWCHWACCRLRRKGRSGRSRRRWNAWSRRSSCWDGWRWSRCVSWSTGSTPRGRGEGNLQGAEQQPEKETDVYQVNVKHDVD